MCFPILVPQAFFAWFRPSHPERLCRPRTITGQVFAFYPNPMFCQSRLASIPQGKTQKFAVYSNPMFPLSSFVNAPSRHALSSSGEMLCPCLSSFQMENLSFRLWRFMHINSKCFIEASSVPRSFSASSATGASTE